MEKTKKGGSCKIFASRKMLIGSRLRMKEYKIDEFLPKFAENYSQ